MFVSFQSTAMAVAFCLGLTFAASPFAAEIPLSLSEAQRLALTHSRQLAAREASIAAARHLSVAAGQLPDPVVKAGIDNLPVSGPERFRLGSDFMTMRRLGISQELIGSAKRQLRTQRSERERERVEAVRNAAVISIERETALAWFDSYFAERMAGVAADQVALAQTELQAAESAYRAGRTTQAELLAARSSLAMVQDGASGQQLRAHSARVMLERWIGPVGARSLADPPAISSIPFAARSLGAHLKHHPDVQVLERQQDLARADVKLAQANRKPDWTVEFMVQQRGHGFGNMVSFGVSVPLQWHRGQRQDREMTARLAMLDESSSELEEAVREHTAITLTLMGEWENKLQRQARFQHELIPLARARTEALRAAYKGGRASLTELLAARRNQIDIQVQALQLEFDASVLWARLTFLLPKGHADDLAATHPGAGK